MHQCIFMLQAEAKYCAFEINREPKYYVWAILIFAWNIYGLKHACNGYM